jgi:hypothetical protein
MYLWLCVLLFCRLCASSVNILSPCSLCCHYMFRPNRPSSGVQIVVINDSHRPQTNKTIRRTRVWQLFKDTQVKQLVNPYNLELVQGNYLRKQNNITVSSRALHHNNLYTWWWWPVRPKHAVTIKRTRRENINRHCIQTAKKQNAKSYTIESFHDWWMISWKFFGRERPWLDRNLPGDAEEKPRKSSE